VAAAAGPGRLRAHLAGHPEDLAQQTEHLRRQYEQLDSSQPGGLRERKKVLTRKALGMAAMRLAIERGLDNVLVEDIAEAAGVSTRTFNNYFASKYEAICSLAFDRAMRIGAALRERPAQECLWTAITNAVMSEYGGADRALDQDWMAGIQLVTSSPALRGESLKVQAMTQYALAEAIALRTAEPGSMFPRILAASVMAAVQAALERWLHADPPTALAPLMRQALRDLADGMRDTLDEASGRSDRAPADSG